MRFIRIILVLLVLTVANFAFSQGGSGQPSSGAALSGQQPAGAGASPAAEVTVEDGLKSLATQLNLNEDQKGKAFSILQEREEQIIQVRNKYPVAKPGSAPSQEGIAAMDKVMKAVHAKMLTILDEEQKKKYEVLDTKTQGPPKN